MANRWATVVVLAALSGGGLAPAFACGDKFIVLGRGVRAQRAKGAVHSARVVMYLDPASELPRATAGLEKELKLAGHSVRLVERRADLDIALEQGRVDVVIAGFSDIQSLAPEARRSPARPLLVPLLFEPTAEELEAAKAQYGCALRSPGSRKHYLGVIEEALANRVKAPAVARTSATSEKESSR